MPLKSKIITIDDIAYQDGWNMLEQVDHEELMWFTCKVMPMVQKHWKPFWTRASNIAKFNDAVAASDEAFGLFLLKYCTKINSFTKKPGKKEPVKGQTKTKRKRNFPEEN